MERLFWGEKKMIDLHTHILPGIDDGAGSIEAALEMAEMAAASGTLAVAATSHGNTGAFTIEQYWDAYEELSQELTRNDIPLELYPGMEIFMDHNVEQKLADGSLLTINETRYVLVEFALEEELWMVNDYLQMLDEAGYIPVIAHAERYAFVQRFPEEVYQWVMRGCVIQVNKGSLLGAYGKKEADMALSLLSHNLIHVVASDAHSPQHRTPKMGNAVRFLNEAVPPKYRELLLSENPRRIVSGEEIAGFPPKPYRRNRYW